MGTQEYGVQLDRTADGFHIHSTVRDFVIELGARRGDPTAGFNAVETLLSAVGTCFATSLGMVAELGHVQVERLRIEVSAVRQDKPPLITKIRYVVFVETGADDAKVDRLMSLAERNSTVIGTLRAAVPLSREWRRYEEALK